MSEEEIKKQADKYCPFNDKWDTRNRDINIAFQDGAEWMQEQLQSENTRLKEELALIRGHLKIADEQKGYWVTEYHKLQAALQKTEGDLLKFADFLHNGAYYPTLGGWSKLRNGKLYDEENIESIIKQFTQSKQNGADKKEG